MRDQFREKWFELNNVVQVFSSCFAKDLDFRMNVATNLNNHFC